MQQKRTGTDAHIHIPPSAHTHTNTQAHQHAHLGTHAHTKDLLPLRELFLIEGSQSWEDLKQGCLDEGVATVPLTQNLQKDGDKNGKVIQL